MKAAIAFLFVALNCYIGFGNTGYTAKGGAQTGIPTIPKDCFQKLITVDLPATLMRLQELLCLYMKGKKEQNEELYKAFLKELHEALKDGGCTADQILSTKDFLESIGDKVGEAAEKFGLQIFKLVEDCHLNELVMNLGCGLLGETLKSLSESMSGLHGATNMVKVLPLVG